MASLELSFDRYRIVFRFAGKKFPTPLKTTEEQEAKGCLSLAMHRCPTPNLPLFIKDPREKRANDEQRNYGAV